MSAQFPAKRRSQLFVAIVLGLSGATALAQDSATDGDDVAEIEEVVVVGTHIKGAQISDALAVSVLSAEDIEILGIDSGDELLDLLPENGNNFFNEAENISGGVNSARGDIGAFNLRSLGTGNTLVLLNGRRVVNAAGFQTEEVGGSFVPVTTANSNSIPVYGLDRLEVLRDGASALYGADAVAGVANTVMKSDYEGFSVRTRYNTYDNVGRNDITLNMEYGTYFNDNKTNFGVFFSYYDRDRVRADEDERWADSDFRRRIPEDSPFAGSTAFRNNSTNSLFGQYDVVRSTSGDPFGLQAAGITDSRGEFETYPAGDGRCAYDLLTGICGAPDGQGTVRYNLNEFRDLNSALERYNVFAYLNHDFGDGLESFTEVSWYDADSNLNRHPSASFSSVKLRVAADNYYNPLGPCGSPNRLPDSVIGTMVPCEGLELEIDNYRFAELPRIVNNSAETWRFLQGLRGTWGEWDWETAIVYSEAERSDVTSNRVSNTLMQEALNDPTPAAYNPFGGGVGSNLERALVDVRRDSESDLKMFDFKISTPTLFDAPSGPVGLLAGFEYREESFVDDRDPRLDGTIVFTDAQGDTFPFVSDVVNSSPTPDNRGERDVTSLFAELAIPVLDTLDVQVAWRYEDFSDVGDTNVGKVAFGWRPLDWLLVRGSWSEAFRAPNLVTINEDIVARTNTREDFVCRYAADFGGDPDQDVLDCENQIQRVAQGSRDLRPEKSDNISFGVVLEPLDNLTITIDYWEIEKEDTIGLFGEENHTLLDLVFLLEQGNANCASVVGNPATVRADVDPDEAPFYEAAGLCPQGVLDAVNDRYANLNTRTVDGIDVGVYYNWETSFGDFTTRFVGSFLEKFEQEPGGNANVLLEAQQSGLIPSNYPVAGFDDLIRRDGNQEERMNLSVAWRYEQFGASVNAFYIGDFFQNSLTLSDGTQWIIPSMTTYNMRFDYNFDLADVDTRVRLGINNVTDERAPLADRFFGYFADSHRDLGRYYYVDLRFSL
ncbi:MAG: TonB-dependent receptor [Pseudomonadota bacterium]